MKARNAVSIEDLRRLAGKRLPGFIFDMIEGGVEDEYGVARNVDAIRKHVLWPRMLRDISQPDLSASLFGRHYDLTFGISATGPAPIYRVKADDCLAVVARKNNIPFILSGTSGTSMETVRQIGGGNVWYQLYPARDATITEDLIKRAADTGIETLVATVDTMVTPKRERHRRNGITTPIKLTPAVIVRMIGEMAKHPGWFFDYFLDGGMPMLENWQRYAPPGASSQEVSAFFTSQFPSSHTWASLERWRSLWKGNFVVKGILHPADAKQCFAIGADGVTVSNHGGKVMDRAPAPIEALPLVRAAVGPDRLVMMDGGIRRGSDIIVARALGADFVFVGRATLYGVAAGKAAGAQRAVDILAEELKLTLQTLGCPRINDVGPEYLSPE